jgi:hypothetical protein
MRAAGFDISGCASFGAFACAGVCDAPLRRAAAAGTANRAADAGEGGADSTWRVVSVLSAAGGMAEEGDGNADGFAGTGRGASTICRSLASRRFSFQGTANAGKPNFWPPMATLNSSACANSESITAVLIRLGSRWVRSAILKWSTFCLGSEMDAFDTAWMA